MQQSLSAMQTTPQVSCAEVHNTPITSSLCQMGFRVGNSPIWGPSGGSQSRTEYIEAWQQPAAPTANRWDLDYE